MSQLQVGAELRIPQCLAFYKALPNRVYNLKKIDSDFVWDGMLSSRSRIKDRLNVCPKKIIIKKSPPPNSWPKQVKFSLYTTSLIKMSVLLSAKPSFWILQNFEALPISISAFSNYSHAGESCLEETFTVITLLGMFLSSRVHVCVLIKSRFILYVTPLQCANQNGIDSLSFLHLISGDDGARTLKWRGTVSVALGELTKLAVYSQYNKPSVYCCLP